MAAVKALPGQIRAVVNGEGETVLETFDVEQVSELASQIDVLNISDPDLMPLVQMLDSLIDQKEQEFQRVEAQYKTLANNLRVMRQMRRVAVPDPSRLVEPKKSISGKRRNRSPRDRVSGENITKIRKWIANQKEPVAVGDIVLGTGQGKTAVQSAVRVLREEGMVRVVGFGRAKGVTYGKAGNLYVITPDGRA
jgi:hypothetical protein